MNIEIISLTPRGDDGVAVTFVVSQNSNEDLETFVISQGRFRQLRLVPGATNTDVYDEVCYYDKLFSACKTAKNALAYGDRSRKSLVGKLRMKGVEPEIAEEAVAELEAKGYLNDTATATREAERAARKLWGKRRISAALFEKGYDEEVVRKAIYALEDSEVDFVENCAELILKKYDGIPQDPKEKSKLFAAMTRYGYTSSEINSAIDKIKEA